MGREALSLIVYSRVRGVSSGYACSPIRIQGSPLYICEQNSQVKNSLFYVVQKSTAYMENQRCEVLGCETPHYVRLNLCHQCQRFVCIDHWNDGTESVCKRCCRN